MHAWVQHDVAARQAHWAALLDSVQFHSMPAAEMQTPGQQLKEEPELVLRMYRALLASKLPAVHQTSISGLEKLQRLLQNSNRLS